MFGKRLAILRDKKKITQEGLANYLGVSRSALALWEQGRREPAQEIIKKISEYFNVSIDYLLGVTDDPCPYDLSNVKTTEFTDYDELVKYLERFPEETRRDVLKFIQDSIKVIDQRKKNE